MQATKIEVALCACKQEMQLCSCVRSSSRSSKPGAWWDNGAMCSAQVGADVYGHERVRGVRELARPESRTRARALH